MDRSRHKAKNSSPPVVQRRSIYHYDLSDNFYEVFIRQTQHPIRLFEVAAALNKRYKSIECIEKINNTLLKVTFEIRKEANHLVANPEFTSLYRVFVPRDRVEVDGVVYLDDLEIKLVYLYGAGVFNDKEKFSLSVLQCNRLFHPLSGKPTSLLRITFPGIVLPDFLMINKVKLPIRPYLPQRILNYKQTGVTVNGEKSMYNASANKEKSTDENTTCQLCHTKHTNINNCAFYQEFKQQFKQNLIQIIEESSADTLDNEEIIQEKLCDAAAKPLTKWFSDEKLKYDKQDKPLGDAHPTSDYGAVVSEIKNNLYALLKKAIEHVIRDIFDRMNRLISSTVSSVLSRLGKLLTILMEKFPMLKILQ